jgi:hypothetical protein
MEAPRFDQPDSINDDALRYWTRASSRESGLEPTDDKAPKRFIEERQVRSSERHANKTKRKPRNK